MIYEFINDKSGKIIERDFSMHDVPKEVVEDGITYRRHWVFSKSVIIPEHFVKNEPKFKYNKSPSKRKHFY